MHDGLSADSGQLRILHLDDNPHDRELVRYRLAADGLGAVISSVGTREEFEGALQGDRFDVVLSDYTVPGFVGPAALECARQQQPDVPLIYVSGTIGEDLAIETIKRGATDYVLKDRLDRLATAIRRALQQVDERRRRAQAELALRESEERIRQMAENIREVFWSRTADLQRIVYVSPAYERIWGRSVAELEAAPMRWFDVIVPDEQERVVAALRRLADGVPYQLEYRIGRPDGSIRWIEDRGYPVRGTSGAIERFVGVALDITQRKELEAELHQAQKMEAIGQLAGGIAHDFNNILTVITGYSRLLLDGDDLPPSLAEPVRQIYTAGTRASNLTRQLLIFSRHQPMQRRPVDLNDIVEEVAAMLRRLIGETIELRVEATSGPIVVEADTGMMEQVLLNLAVNARDAMPDGGTVTIANRRVVLDEAAVAPYPGARVGEYACLSVRDTGCGIPAENLARIFEPFYTTKEPGRGTGLGLATVLAIIRQHEGWIEVDSAPGQGATFRVLVPLSQRSVPAALAGPAHGGGAAGASETILLVEDDYSVREFAAAVLRSSGFRVLQAASGPDALEAWKWHHARISLLFTDLVIPLCTSGIALAEQMRREKPSLKVVVTTGYTADVSGDLKTPDGTRFVHKPYKPDVLIQTLRDALDERIA